MCVSGGDGVCEHHFLLSCLVLTPVRERLGHLSCRDRWPIGERLASRSRTGVSTGLVKTKRIKECDYKTALCSPDSSWGITVFQLFGLKDWE